MCEISGHLADLSQRSRSCARAFADVASSWAAAFQSELDSVRDNAASHGANFAVRERELQAKCAIAHLLAVLCHGSLVASPGERQGWGAANATLSRNDAAALCHHRVQADLHAFNDGTGELHTHLRVVGEQCQHAMAALIRPLDAAAGQHPDMLTRAVCGVFADLPQAVQWRPVAERLGCYVAEAGGQVYSISLMSGAALCNGMRPGHLPRPILRDGLYRRVFKDRTFQVSHLQIGRQDVFRTTQAHGGRAYSFQQVAGALVVKEHTVDSQTGQEQPDLDLQLLPGAPPSDSSIPIIAHRGFWDQRSTGLGLHRHAICCCAVPCYGWTSLILRLCSRRLQLLPGAPPHRKDR